MKYEAMECCVDICDVPESAALKAVRSSPWRGYGEGVREFMDYSDEEVGECWEFIRWFLQQEWKPLLEVPAGSAGFEFWFDSYEEFLESAFNTHDFQKDRKPFDKYAYRVRKVLEQVEDLALLHSCISEERGRVNVRRRFESLVECEFRQPLLRAAEMFRACCDPLRRFDLKRRVGRLNGLVLECEGLWRALSPPD